MAVVVLGGFTVFTDWLWFSDVGYGAVFVKMITSQATLGLLGAALLWWAIMLNVWLAVSGRRHLEPVTITGEFLSSRRVLKYAALAALVISIFVGLALGAQWLVVHRFLNASLFGLEDPFFGRDVGFFVFTLPFLQLGYQYLFMVLILSFATAAGVYYFYGSLQWQGLRLQIRPRARNHLAVLLGLGFLLRAAGYQLGIWRLLFSPRGVAFGASYTDIHAQLPANRILMVLTVIIGAVVIFSMFRRSLRLAGGALALLFVTSVGLGWAYPSLVQSFQVSPNELDLETEFIRHNIAFTNAAFGLDRITETEFPATFDLTLEDIEANRDTLDNIRLWDWRPLRETYSQLQEMRTYYTFYDVDMIRYRLDDELRAVMISAREMNHDQLNVAAQTWLNHHLKFTHGYGAVLSPGNVVTPQGLPDFFLRDIPPRGREEFTLHRPEIYFGELTHNYALVNTTEEEFNYPIGEINAYTTYEGRAGVSLGSWLNRVAFGLRFRHYQILVSSTITSESRILFRRHIMDRVRTIAPFLKYDGDPYLVLDDGRLFWIIDAYTVSSGFPYSEHHASGINYIRNSVKIVIDAYHGDTDFYIFEPDDPLIQTYSKIFPDLFKDKSEMPASLQEHVRYPSDMFRIQAEKFTVYHMRDPRVFYNKEDQWNIPNEILETRRQPMEPYYIIIRLPDEPETEFLLMLPFTPAQRQNMIAWLGGRSDGDNYGELKLFRFPKEELVFGPMQVEARIDQDSRIAQELTLWGQLGTQVNRGNLLVIPIEDSLLYVEPLYLQARDNRLPELKQVFVIYEDIVVMEDNLDQALHRIFGEGERTYIDDDTEEELIWRAISLYRQAQERLQVGDWAGYGEVWTELGEVLERLEEIRVPVVVPDPPPVE